MRYPTIVLALGACLLLLAGAPGCGGDDEPTGNERGCIDACEQLRDKFGLDCSEPYWAAARDCDSCIAELQNRHDVMVDETCFCPKYFQNTTPPHCR